MSTELAPAPAPTPNSPLEGAPQAEVLDLVKAPAKKRINAAMVMIKEQYDFMKDVGSNMYYYKQVSDSTFSLLDEDTLEDMVVTVLYSPAFGGATPKEIEDVKNLIRSVAAEKHKDLSANSVEVANGLYWNMDDAELSPTPSSPCIYKLFSTDHEDKHVVKTSVDKERLLKVYKKTNNELKESRQVTTKFKFIETWADGNEDIYLDMVRAISYCFVKEKPVGSYILVGEKRNGKSKLYNDTPVLSKVKGELVWRTQGTLEAGDLVATPEGVWKPVIERLPSSEEPCYEVELYDGRKEIASWDHQWSVVTRTYHLPRGRENGKLTEKRKVVRYKTYEPEMWKVMTTEEMLKNLKKPSGDARYYVPPSLPVEMPERELPIDPYILGCAIGDVHIIDNGYLTITNADYGICSLFDNCKVDQKKTEASGTKQWIARTSKYANDLVSLGLNGARSYEKFIPEQYLLSSIEQRYELLRGLLDTDGYIHQEINQVEFSTTSKKLADGIRSLVFSLGGTATVKSRMVRYDDKETRTNYRVFIRSVENPFKLRRKADKWKPQKRSGYVGVKSIKPIGVKKCNCISVDDEYHTYLVGRNFVPTHNCFVGMMHTIFGKNNTSAVQLSRLGDPHFVNDLRRTLMNAPDEEEDIGVDAAATFKTIADHGEIIVSVMRSNKPARIPCNFMCFYPMNHIPQWKGTGASACLERSLVIPFYADLSRFDKASVNFARETFTKETMSDLMGVVFAYAKYYSSHPLEFSSTMMKERGVLVDESASGIKYREHFEKYFSGFENLTLLYNDYVLWCKANDVMIQKKNEFKFLFRKYLDSRTTITVPEKKGKIAMYKLPSSNPNTLYSSRLLKEMNMTVERLHEKNCSVVERIDAYMEEKKWT